MLRIPQEKTQGQEQITYLKYERIYMSNAKANSIIAFPDTYVVIDVETTGRSTTYDELIEVSALKISNNTITDTFSSLIRPLQEITAFITELTGITNEMVASAPPISAVIDKYIDFIGTHTLVGHNINYDINFINKYAELNGMTPISNNFVDTLRIFRKLYPNLKHHRLSDMATLYKIDCSNAHRALADCEITHKCFCSLSTEVNMKYPDISQFIELFKTKNGSKKLRASDISATVAEIDSESPLFEKTFVFTGTLDKMSRKEAMQIVVNHGGINGDNVTKKTNYLVLGNSDYCTAIKTGKSTKHKKAESLLLSGQDIAIIPEDVFYEMISE